MDEVKCPYCGQMARTEQRQWGRVAICKCGRVFEAHITEAARDAMHGGRSEPEYPGDEKAKFMSGLGG